MKPIPGHHYPRFHPTATSKSYYPSDHGFIGGSAYESSIHFDHHPPSHTTHHVIEKNSKALSLKDLFDIALTALAFLSFGLFILQVLLCLTMKKQSAGMVMMPGGGGGGDGDGDGELGKRTKRAIDRAFDDDVRKFFTLSFSKVF